MSKINKIVVFILSETRSGSTWLSYVLGSHQNAVHLGEYYRPFTRSGHVACRLCEAKGKKKCKYLHGIENISEEKAFDFAFERFNKQYLIDCSKQLTWLKKFVFSETFQVKIIHLMRDPRAWYASEKRRNNNLKIYDAMNRWIMTNTSIKNTIKELSLSHVTSFYDELCLHPDDYFSSDISSFLEMPFESEALEYWKKEHHGLGGNGAALNNLFNYPQRQVVTGDDEYYRKNLGRHFYDSRWLEQLSPDERKIIERMPSINEYLNKHGKNFTHFNDLLKETVG